MKAPAQTPIPVLESFVKGLVLFKAHRQIMLKMAFVPFAVTLLTLVVLRGFREDLSGFILPILQIPSSFLTGLLMALMLRYLLLAEHPIIPEGPEKRARNKAIAQAGLAYAVVTYIISGLYMGMLNLQEIIEVDPEMAAPYMPLGFAAMVFLLWGARWFWLQVPLAVEWPVTEFYKRVGRWGGSLRIFALFGVCSLCMNFVTGLFRMFCHVLFGKINVGFTAALDDAILAAATLSLALLFTMATVAALQTMMQVKKT